MGASNTPHTVNSLIELHVCCGAQVVVTIQVVLVIPSVFSKTVCNFAVSWKPSRHLKGFKGFKWKTLISKMTTFIFEAYLPRFGND
jgi:hypothetical protein